MLRLQLVQLQLNITLVALMCWSTKSSTLIAWWSQMSRRNPWELDNQHLKVYDPWDLDSAEGTSDNRHSGQTQDPWRPRHDAPTLYQCSPDSSSCTEEGEAGTSKRSSPRQAFSLLSAILLSAYLLYD